MFIITLISGPAKDNKDYTGGSNNFEKISEEGIDNLIKRISFLLV